MNKFRVVFLLLSLVGLLAHPGLAQEQNLAYTLQILHAPTAPPKKIMERQNWQRFLEESGVNVIEESGGSGALGDDFMVFPGIKNPLAYRDPKPDSYQVQYADVGLKLETLVRAAENGFLRVDARCDRSVLNPHPKLKSRTNTLLFQSAILMKPGQVAVFGCARGPVVERLMKEQLPPGQFQPGDWIIMALTIE